MKLRGSLSGLAENGRHAGAVAAESRVSQEASTIAGKSEVALRGGFGKTRALEHCPEVSWAPRSTIISSDHLIADSDVYQLQGDRAIVNFFFLIINKTSPSQPDWEFTA